jgi:hypothetical protein
VSWDLGEWIEGQGISGHESRQEDGFNFHVDDRK